VLIRDRTGDRRSGVFILLVLILLHTFQGWETQAGLCVYQSEDQ
jgi:hypothetical protein